MTTQYYETTDALADHLTDIAARLRTVGPVTRLWLSSLSIQVTSQGSADPAQRIATIDALAAALGLPPAETREVFGDSYHRRASDDIVTVYGVVPAPIEVQREQLLARLAELDAQEAARRATALAALAPDSPELPDAAYEPLAPCADDCPGCVCQPGDMQCSHCYLHVAPVDEPDGLGQDYIADPAARIADIAQIAPEFVALVTAEPVQTKCPGCDADDPWCETCQGRSMVAVAPVGVDSDLIADVIATTQRISDERVAEIVDYLNRRPNRPQAAVAETDAWIRALPELDQVLSVGTLDEVLAFQLKSGAVVGFHIFEDKPWSVER